MGGQVLDRLMKHETTWFGAIASPDEFRTSRAISPAASKWQTSLISSLAKKRSIRIVGYLPDRAFPGGRLWIPRSKPCIASGIECSRVSYLNAPRVRDRWIAAAAIHELDDRRMSGTLITYNASYAAQSLGHYWRRRGGTWVCVLADYDSQEEVRGALDNADGIVALSYHTHASINVRNKIHLDGGLTGSATVRLRQASERPCIVCYTGAISPYTGVYQLVEAWRATNIEAELWITGTGELQRLRRLVHGDPRIRVLGLLSEAELAAVMMRATVFVNPRPQGLSANMHNFPSKLLEYLNSGRTVVTTWSAGLDPIYRRVCIVAENDTPRAMMNAIYEALSSACDEHKQIARHGELVHLFSARSWDAQAERLHTWLAALEGNNPRGVGN